MWSQNVWSHRTPAADPFLMGIPSLHTRRPEVLALPGLLAVTLVVFWPSFQYGFVSDDFVQLTRNSWERVWGAWQQEGFRRPLDELFFLIFWKAFGFHALPFRIFLFGLYFLNTVLVYRLTTILLREPLSGLVVAAMFAANLVQFRNVYWVSCAIFLMETTFFLGALLCFLRRFEGGGRGWSALALALAILGVFATKEHLAMFPVVAALAAGMRGLASRGSLMRGDIRSIARSTAIFWLVPVFFVGQRVAFSVFLPTDMGCPYDLTRCLGSDRSDPFFASLWGIHLLTNLAHQAYWNLGNLGIYWLDGIANPSAGRLEWRAVGQFQYALISAYGALLAAAYWWLRQSASWGTLALGGLWFTGLLVPVLILPNHGYPYFSAFASVGLWIAVVMPFSRLRVSRHRSRGTVGLVLLVVLFLANSLYWTHQNRSTHLITSTSKFLTGFEAHLKFRHPTVPQGATLVFPNIEGWHLGYRLAPAFMYGDPSIRTLAKEDVSIQGGRISVNEQVELDPSRTVVFLLAPEGLRDVTAEFFLAYQTH